MFDSPLARQLSTYGFYTLQLGSVPERQVVSPREGDKRHFLLFTVNLRDGLKNFVRGVNEVFRLNSSQEDCECISPILEIQHPMNSGSLYCWFD